jgi:tetratricopeptide (TPR) repeat protein
MSQHLVAEALTALKNRDFRGARAHIAAYGRDHMFELRHYMIQGLAEMALADWQDAVITFTDAARQFPDQAQLWFNLGVAQENLRDYAGAAASYERSLARKADQAEACGNLSNVYRRLGRFAEAEAMARRAIAYGAPKVQALNILGLALGRQGKFAEAEQAFAEVLQIDPANAEVLANRANLCIDRLDFSAAWPLFADARAKNDLPVIRHHEGMAQLLFGDFEQGWNLCEARLDPLVNLRVQPNCPRYTGGSLAGKKLMLVAEQGQGDTIQFCRYGKLLAQTGAELIWVVQKSLQRLLAVNLTGQVYADSDLLPEADFYLPLMSLPLALHKYMPSEAPTAPYLQAPAEPKLLAGKNKNRRIGLVWSGSSTHERDAERSISLAQFAPLWENIAAEFYAPFVGPGLDQIADEPVVPLDEMIADFADTAALLMQLDCLITVDTAAAHLAGALGVKTFLLLPYCPDWRWGTQGTTTPWYPSLTLLRQQKPGDWSSVITQLKNNLAL